MSELPDPRLYFAQNREDIILEAFFPDIEKGFYVDVGACHPDDVSVTKRFYLKGWNGINIEPQTNLYGLFMRDRQRDINLNIGVGNKKGTLKLRSYIYNQGLSSVVDDVKRQHERHENNSEVFEDIEIPVLTLKDIFDEHKPTNIHFLKVDVEGYEYEVLEGNDWKKYRPEVVCLEANHVVNDWRPILKRNSYEFVFFDGLNEYYVDLKTDRAKKFDYVGQVISELAGGLSYSDYEKIDSLSRSNDELKLLTTNQAKELESLRKLLRRILRLAPARVKKMIRSGKRSN